MNYVGQLAGQVFVQVKELYRGLNPATLSGCIDVIVVRQPDGSLQCSPFHVRFGKMGVLRSREKVVDIEINGEPVSLHMKLGENGEAFFVKETESDMEMVPPYLATSPIITDGSALMESQLGNSTPRLTEPITGTSIQSLGPAQASGDNSITKKRRKRRRKSRVDNMKREDNGDSEDEDMFPIDMSSDEEKEIVVSRATSREPYSEQQLYSFCFSSSGNDSLPPSPKSDSELLVKQTSMGKPKNPEMLWAWGELPHAAKVHKHTSHVLFISKLQHYRNHYLNKKNAFLAVSVMLVVKKFRTYTGHLMDLITPTAPEPAASVEEEAIGAAARLITGPEIEPHSAGTRDLNKTDSPSKRKDKRSRHLGSDGVYLDDLTELEPEVAALYFPKRNEGYLKTACFGQPRSANQSPQSVGSSGTDSGVDTFSEHLGDLPNIAISLCGGLTENQEIKEFQERAISYQDFVDNPAIIDDPNLVVKIGTKYYNWSTAAPLMLAMQVFQKPLPKAAVESIMKEKMPKKGGRWWFSWRGRNSSSKSVGCRPKLITALHLHQLKDESSSSDEDNRTAEQTPPCAQKQHPHSPASICYRKTLRLSSEQLASLQLKEGPNDVVFSVTTQYQGTCRCEGTIYLWKWDDKLVISDIDGTITRSDTLGHILPTLGKDWTHQGIARLYHKVSQNGYKFMYCSARAIGMAGMTRGYLHWVNERGTMLPQGPVLLSPSSLFSALHREVIEKKPEKFKIECLTDIKNLFHPNIEPFYAAFGNRATDVYSYKEVGVPLNRIFTVNPKGELIQEHAKTNISSYGRLCEVVDHVFPLLLRGNTSDFPCCDTYSQFTYWREQLQELDKPEQTVENS
uniref:phosphatidate phosphatase n=1 Tax=Astyanax mexicanus TaxID=7994 RepID=A0A8B9K6T3_ASTMX